MNEWTVHIWLGLKLVSSSLSLYVILNRFRRKTKCDGRWAMGQEDLLGWFVVKNDVIRVSECHVIMFRE